jgi:hypothetical protein
MSTHCVALAATVEACPHLINGCLAAADLLLPERFSRCCPQPGYRSGYDQG